MENKTINHFISVLGTNNYEQSNYIWEDENCNTRFAQEAILKKIEETAHIDKISILLTEQAHSTNWIDTPEKKGLKSILSNHYKDILNAVPTPDGNNQEEIDKTFNVLYDTITENETIYFDITHGFRHLPMLILTVLEYAKKTKNITIGGIYYGMFRNEVSESPIIDITYYSDILSWSNAAASFIQFGNSNEINTLFQDISRGRSREDSIEKKEKYGDLPKLVSAINDVTQCVNTGRGKYVKGKKSKELQKSSIKGAYENYKNIFNRIDLGLAKNYQPFQHLVDIIDNKMKIFDTNDNLELGLATIEWSIKNGMIQQGYTALDETTKTYICVLADVSDSTQLYREDFAKRILNVACKNARDINYGKEQKSNPDFLYSLWEKEMYEYNIFDKFIHAEHDASIENMEDFLKIRARNVFHLLPEEFISMMQSITQNRNDINHFGFSTEARSYDKLSHMLNEKYETFKKIIGEMNL